VDTSIRVFSTSQPVPPRAYDHLVAIDIEVQRLQLGDVIMADAPGHDAQVEARVLREIDRTGDSVFVTLRVAGADDFVKEWPLDAMVTVVRGP
jgi:hypothetical protein